MVKANWACISNNPDHITLNRLSDVPAGQTGANHLYSCIPAGYGQPPYMLGIEATAMKWASAIDDVEAVNYAELASEVSGRVHDTGYDPATQGIWYGSIYAACEPAPAPATTFNYTAPDCGMGLAPDSIRASRGPTAEPSSALRAYYEHNPSPDRRSWGDFAYGSIWEYAPFTTGGVYSGPYYVKNENSNPALAAYKLTGFFFGTGIAHQWPAVRVGGVEPRQNRRVFIAFSLADVPDGVGRRRRMLG